MEKYQLVEDSLFIYDDIKPMVEESKFFKDMRFDLANMKNERERLDRALKEKGYTFCMIEHDMDFIGRLCDPVIVMAEGSVLFEGSVEDAKKDEKVIESYLGRGSKLKDN